MTTQTFRKELPVPQADLFAWHSRPGAFERLAPPWQSISIVHPAPLEEGSRVRLSLRKGPFRFAWTADHREVRPDDGFVDVQTEGPFARWIHRHDFEATDRGSVLSDSIDYALPGGPVGALLAGATVRRDLSSTFAYRQETTARDLARHREFADTPRLRVAVSGAGGLVGGQLVPFLTTGGHEVVRIVRRPTSAPDEIHWDAATGLSGPPTGDPVDTIVHLAGESIADGRWTAARKERIRSSRVDGTRRLVRSLAHWETPPRTLVCASAIGFYGSRGDARLDEDSAPGRGFLAEVCREWEAAAEEAKKLGMRVVMVRFGIILTPAGGALAKMLLPFKLGAGGRIGDGHQYMSWVSIDDAVHAIHQAIQDESLTGPVNVVSPNPVTNREFTKALGRALSRPTIAPLPSFAARLVFGEMADEMLLSSARVEPRRLTETGFRFDDPELEPALARLLGKTSPE